MLMSAPPPEPLCAELSRAAGSQGQAAEGGGRQQRPTAARRGREEAGGERREEGLSGGYLDSVGRLLESDQHVPVSPAGRVPGSELRRGGQSRG